MGNCKGACCDFVKTTNIEISGTTLVLTIPNETLFDGMERRICLVQNIPDYTGIPSVAIQTGTTLNTALATHIRHCNGKCDCTPNNLYVDQLVQDCGCESPKIKNRISYVFRYAADTNCWNLCRPVKKSCGVQLKVASATA